MLTNIRKLFREEKADDGQLTISMREFMRSPYRNMMD